MADDAGHASTTSQPQVAFKPRNLVVLSDGTGNSAAKLFRTNIWRIYEALDLNCDDQVALYDDGVGTASFKPLAAIGGAFGYGLKRNVLDLYRFLCRNYSAADGYEYNPRTPTETDEEHKRHDHIFAFGFSRGAFTARVVAGLVAHEGLIPRQETDAELNRLAAWAYRSYRAKRYRHASGVKLLREIRDRLLRLLERTKPVYNATKNRQVPIEFLGVFDTVAAYGLPVDELTRGWDRWVWPMTPRDNSLHERVKYGRHALAIDDERQTFFPLLWDEDSDKEKQHNETFKHAVDRIKQVWFAGMHSNVGGGYADDALSLGPLCWMAGEATAHGLRFQADMLRPNAVNEKVPVSWLERAAPCAPMGDSRKGVAAYYRYHPRPIGRLCGFEDHSTVQKPKSDVRIDLPKIHESVFERIKDGRDRYAPFALPPLYAVVRRSGEILHGDADAMPPAAAPNTFEHSTQAASRLREQQSAWDEVWKRRVTYFLTVGSTLFLLALPLVPAWLLPFRNSSNTAATALGAVSGFAPGFAQGWLDAYHDRPVWFFLVAAFVGGFLWLGSGLKGKVNDRMGRVWERPARHGLQAAKLQKIAPVPTGKIYKLRESPAYKGTFRFMSDKVWPNVFGFAIMLVILFVTIAVIPLRLAYQVASRMDSFCSASGGFSQVKVEIPDASAAPGSTRSLDAREMVFYPDEICRRITGFDLLEGHRYAIQIAIPLDPVEVDVRNGKTIIDERNGCRGEVTDERDKRKVGGWMDGSIHVPSAAGIGSKPIMVPFLPFRRIWGANWMVPIAAIGTRLPERHYLTDSTTEVTVTRNGPLSLYANDAALPIGPVNGALCASSGFDCYYANNTGGPARVRVTELDANTPATALPTLAAYTCDEQKQKLQKR